VAVIGQPGHLTEEVFYACVTDDGFHDLPQDAKTKLYSRIIQGEFYDGRRIASFGEIEKR